jgi:peroxiredoxin
VPGYLEKQDALKAAGIDEVIVYCVNDAAVMKAWAKDNKIEGTILTFLSDAHREFTEALGVTMDHPAPLKTLGSLRCKRHALFVNDGIIKVLNVSEGKNDPAGDRDPSASCVDRMLADAIKSMEADTAAPAAAAAE